MPMKREHTKWVLALVLAGSIGVISTQAVAGVESKGAVVSKAMMGVRVPELAAKAAVLVKQADIGDREAIAVAVVEYVAKAYPAAVKSVISSIAKAEPSLAPKIAARAAELLPQDSVALASAAALGAKQFAPQVAASVAKANPKMAPEVTETVILAVPQEAVRTADAVAAAVPSAKDSLPVIERSAMASGGTPIIIQRKKPIPPSQSLTGQDTPGYDYARP